MTALSIGFDVPFDEAIKAATTRGVVLPEVYYGELQGVARQLAFSIAGISAYDQLQAVRDSLATAMADGKSFREWKKTVPPEVFELPNYRLENIWRTNLQGNYMRGRWERFTQFSATRPFLMYDAINDTRVRPSHLAHDGVIRPVHNRYWLTHSPPLGYNCRCTLVSLTEGQAHARSGPGKGLYQEPRLPNGDLAEPDTGWDYNPFGDRLEAMHAVRDKRIIQEVDQAAVKKAQARLVSGVLKDVAKAEGQMRLEYAKARLQAQIEWYKLEQAKLGNMGYFYKKASEKLAPGQSLDELAAELKAKHTLSSQVSGYKKAVLAGKKPNKSQLAAFESLPEGKKAAILADLKMVVEPAKGIRAAESLAVDDMAGWTQVGAQAGSNPGGFFTDSTGAKWYVKFPASEEIARNEVLAGKLYELSGVDVPELKLISKNGKIGVASRIVEGLVKDQAALAAGADGVAKGFAVDAWLANWDVVGLGYDNMLLLEGKAFRVDVGGSLLYRAQGGLKGASFGDSIGEFESLLSSMNPQSRYVFQHLSEAQIKASALRVYALNDAEIRRICQLYGPGTMEARDDLADLLIRRKGSIGKLFPDIPKLASEMLSSASNVAVENFGVSLAELDDSIVTAVKGIKTRIAKGEVVGIKDIQRVADVTQKYAGVIGSDVLTTAGQAAIKSHYDEIVSALSASVSGGELSSPSFVYEGQFAGIKPGVDWIKLTKLDLPYNPGLFGADGGIRYTKQDVLDIISRSHSMGSYIVSGTIPERKGSKDFFKNMPEEYPRALWGHTTSYIYDDINQVLLDCKLNNKPIPPHIANYEKLLNEALKNAPEKYKLKGRLTRGMTPRDFEGFVSRMEELHKAGKPYQFETISSSGMGEHGYPGKVQLHIDGKSGVDVKSISQYPHENEVLFGTDTKFIITKTIRDGNTYDVWLKEI